MFRISAYVRELTSPTPLGPKRNPPGPVVIWNLIRRCNLTCKHCYSISADKDFAGELGTDEVFRVMDELKAFRVPVLILSGGEPLLRPDIFEIAGRAKKMGFYVGLSSNGTLIDASNIDAIAATDFDYVGVSLDGAFDRSLAGLRLCAGLGVKVGVRFTMTQDNAGDLPGVLQLVEDEGIDRFYFSHLNYAGRGNIHRDKDAHHQATRQAMDLLFNHAWADAQAGSLDDYVSGNNDADGPYLLQWAREHLPQWEDALRQRLVAWGGNASGQMVANIDNLGHVHPDTMWWHHDLGSVRERPFSQIWNDTSDPLMAGLKQHPRPVQGRCASCQYLTICNGNTRVRAQQLTGNPWFEDPGCYLTDAEVGASSTPFESPAKHERRRTIEIAHA